MVLLAVLAKVRLFNPAVCGSGADTRASQSGCVVVGETLVLQFLEKNVCGYSGERHGQFPENFEGNWLLRMLVGNFHATVFTQTFAPMGWRGGISCLRALGFAQVFIQGMVRQEFGPVIQPRG